MLKKLERYGIRGKAYDLDEDYLHNREQFVKINDKVSSKRNVKLGVPQGSILGPLLFLVYINDLLRKSCISYDDDTTALCEANSWDEAVHGMNCLLNKINEWLTLNQLSINVDKTIYMTFGPYCDSVPDNLNILIGNVKNKRVVLCKYLGVLIDFKVRWEDHTDNLVNKTNYLIYVFYRSRKIMSKRHMLMFYYALFHSQISYGTLAWGGAYSGVLERIQNAQNEVIKLLNTDNILHIEIYKIESLLVHYEELSKRFIKSSSITRNKSLILPRIYKEIYKKVPKASINCKIG